MKTPAFASVLLMSWLAASSARAQSAADVQPGAEAAADHEAAASALVEQAARAYDQNQLDEALQLLARAFALSPRPSILYNQAQVLRTKDDCVAALDAYRRFIEATAPDDPDRERALRRRDEMQACADQRASRPKPVEPAPAPPVQAPPTQPPPALVPPPPAPAALVVSAPLPPEDRPVNHRRALRVAGWAALGVGVVAAGVAAAYAWEAHHIQGELQAQLNTDLGQSNPTWTDHQQSQYLEGSRDASRAWWCVGTAALAGGGGSTLLILSGPPAAAGATAGTPSEPRGALIGWSGTF